MNLPPFLLLQEYPDFSKTSFLFFTLVLKLFSFLQYTFFLFISASFLPINTKICSIFYHFLKHLPSFPQFPCSYYPFLCFLFFCFFFTARFPHLSELMSIFSFFKLLQSGIPNSPLHPTSFLWNSLVPCHQSNEHFRSLKSWPCSIFVMLYDSSQVYTLCSVSFATSTLDQATIIWLLDYNSS